MCTIGGTAQPDPVPGRGRRYRPSVAAARRRDLKRVLFVVVGLLVAINFLVLAGRSHPSDTAHLPLHVQALLPLPEQQIDRGDTVGAQLDSGYQGLIYINGAVVPPDQITGDPGLGEVTFRPGCAGARSGVSASECQLRNFDPGTLNLRIDYWPSSESYETAVKKKDVASYAWQASVT
jgi:hypothetical protein